MFPENTGSCYGALMLCEARHFYTPSPFAVSTTASREDEKQWLSVCWNLPRVVRAANPSQPGLPAQGQRESGSDTALLLLWLCVLSASPFYWFCFSLDAACLGQGHRKLASQGCLKHSSALTSDLWWKLTCPRNQE